ncbi:MAG: HlyC/CorC family transporter [Eubacteriales bacterium]|nr:HlyC/CorC family transporter [Eubacteriales bacterium]
MDSDISLIVYISLLMVGSAYFSATETAFSSLNRIKMKNLAQSGNKRAKLTLDLCKKYDRLLTSILVGNNILNILSSSLATTLFVAYFPKHGVALSTIVMTLIVLIFGEISPKSIAKEVPEKFAMFSAPIISVVLWILTPVCLFFTLIKNGIAKLLKIRGENAITDDEILTMVEEATSEGSIDEDEGDLIKNAIEFYELEVSDILTPRVDVVAIDSTESNDEIRKAFEDSGFSRLPVYEETIDNIIGVLNHKDFQQQMIGAGIPIEASVSQTAFVAPNMKVSVLLALLQKNKSHIAVVTDEYGGTVGIVTLEDILEELVGEIWDEHDMVQEDFTRYSDTCYRVRAVANCEKLFELFDIEEEPESTTVGGWVMEMLGKVPDQGDSFKYENLTVTVTKTEENRVREVVVIADKIAEQAD